MTHTLLKALARLVFAAADYLVKEEKYGVYTVSKWEGTKQPTAVYTVKVGNHGFLECNCPARKACKHKKLVADWICEGKKEGQVIEASSGWVYMASNYPHFHKDYGKGAIGTIFKDTTTQPTEWKCFVSKNEDWHFLRGSKPQAVETSLEKAQKVCDRIAKNFVLAETKHISLEEAKANPYYWTCYLLEDEDPNKLHVTHKFMKDQTPENVASILKILDEYWGKYSMMAPMLAKFDKEEYFGKDKDVHVLSSDDPRFERAQLRTQLDKFADDQFPGYKPHVTTDEKCIEKMIVGYAFMYGKEKLKTWWFK